MNSGSRIKCTSLNECDGQMRLVEISYGFTGGDKWQCNKCESYVVTRPGELPAGAQLYVDSEK